MLTRCPTCDTAFRITPEQLKIRAGQVRCGACQRVFSALETLVEEPPLVINQPLPGEPLPLAEPESTEPPPVDEALAAPADETGLATPPDDMSPVDAMALISETEPVTNTVTEPSPVEIAAPMATATEAGVEALEEPQEKPAELPPQTIPEHEPQPESEPEPASESAPILVETVDWHDNFPASLTPPAPPRRWPWFLASVLALLILILQTSLAMRVDWASRYPETRPYLETLCALAGCRIDLPQKVELLEIETSNLQPDSSNAKLLSLTATLKNRAPFAQQFPALEITLTDLADKAIARKVMTPKDYLATGTHPAAGMSPNGDLAISVTIDADELAASGYRLYLFYP